MSNQIDTAFVQAYKNNIEVGFQQKGSRLRPYVRVETQNAEYDFYDRVTSTAAVKVTSRHGDTPLISTPHDRRRCQLVDYDWADLIDRNDRLRMLADPTSAYTTNAIFALGRSMDDEIISAASGTAYSGKTGSTSTTFDTTNNRIAANYVESGGATASNLTIGKLRKARQILDAAEAAEDGEALILALTSNQIQSLLRTTEITSSDYNTVKALVNGEVDTFMGFKFVRTERLTKSGNNRTCLAWARNGLLLGMAQDIMVDVGPRRDKRNSTQVYVCASFGATRMWESKVVEILCDETV